MASSKKRFVWLFGENVGETMDNNSWYTFKEAVTSSNYKDIDSYFTVARTASRAALVNHLPKNIRDHVIWRNSKKHVQLYRDADMFFVSLSYRDVLPDKYGSNNVRPKPTVYLQHGITAIKRLGYKPDTYKNSLFRFVCYSQNEIDLLRSVNKFASYQTVKCGAMPRWSDLIRLDRKCNDKSTVLWFITWRDYLNSNRTSQEKFLHNITDVLNDTKLQNWLEANDLKINVCLHNLFDIDLARSLIKSAHASTTSSNRISLRRQSDINLMSELATARMIVTDYSSIGFDATVIKKPVVLYQFDRTRYQMKRNLYIDLYSDIEDVCTSPIQLIARLTTHNQKDLNPFFTERLDEVDDKLVLNGSYTRQLLDRLASSVRNKVTFIGYNFYGKGGTVTATKALAESLMEKGYLVDLLSLKKTRSSSPTPPGIVIRNLYHGGKSIQSRIKRLFKNNKYLGSLNYDINKNLLVPYVGIALAKYLERTNSRTIISTRETMHPFLSNAVNSSIANKIYYFHTAPDIIDEYYPGIMDLLKTTSIENAAFVTENSRIGYKEIFNFDTYKKYAVTGNTLQNTSILQPDEIARPIRDDVLSGVSLIRMSTDRANDISKIIEYGKYLCDNSIDNIVINVYGGGDYVDDFISQIDAMNIGKYIKYRGVTSTPYRAIRNSDFLVDFSLKHSFGMTYIEAILNGRQCFATVNEGSTDVLAGIPKAMYTSWDTLTKYIVSSQSTTKKQLIRNYMIVSKKYGHEAVSDKIEDLFDRKVSI